MSPLRDVAPFSSTHIRSNLAANVPVSQIAKISQVEVLGKTYYLIFYRKSFYTNYYP